MNSEFTCIPDNPLHCQLQHILTEKEELLCDIQELTKNIVRYHKQHGLRKFRYSKGVRHLERKLVSLACRLRLWSQCEFEFLKDLQDAYGLMITMLTRENNNE